MSWVKAAMVRLVFSLDPSHQISLPWEPVLFSSSERLRTCRMLIT